MPPRPGSITWIGAGTRLNAASNRPSTLNRECAIAHMRYGWFLLFTGRTQEGFEHILTADTLDKLLPKVKKNIGNAYFVEREYDKAMAYYEEALDLWPHYAVPHS